MDVKGDRRDENLVDSCFQILTQTEEILSRVRDVFRGLAQGRETPGPEKAAAIAAAIEAARQAAEARVADYRRLNETPTPPRIM